MTNSDLESYFAEHDAIFSGPDESVNEFIDRISKQPRRCADLAPDVSNDDPNRSNRMKWTTSLHLPSRDVDEQRNSGQLGRVAVENETSISREDIEHEDRRWRLVSSS